MVQKRKAQKPGRVSKSNHRKPSHPPARRRARKSASPSSRPPARVASAVPKSYRTFERIVELGREFVAKAVQGQEKLTDSDMPFDFKKISDADKKRIKETFLKVLDQEHKHAPAIAACGAPWRALSLWMTEDETFLTDYKAIRRAIEELRDIQAEDEAHRRAVEGWEEPVHYMGIPTSSVRKFSDPLLAMRLKGAKPSKYADRLEHSGPGGGPIPMVNAPPQPATLKEWEEQTLAAEKGSRK